MTPTDLIETRLNHSQRMRFPSDPDTRRRLRELTFEVRESWWRRVIRRLLGLQSGFTEVDTAP